MTALTIDDPRLRFYLERRREIEEWASLRTLETDAANAFLRGLAVDLEAVAADLGDDVLAVPIFDADGEETLGLARTSWQVEGSHPKAVAALAWYPRRVRFAGSGFDTAWVGPRIRRSEHFKVFRAAVGQAIESEGLGKAEYPVGKPTGNTAWPRYRLAPCTHPTYWDDLAPYRAELLVAVRSTFELFAPVVDRVLAQGELDATP